MHWQMKMEISRASELTPLGVRITSKDESADSTVVLLVSFKIVN